MLNTLYIDATNSCECTLVSSVDDKTARLQLNIICDTSLNPQLEIVGGRTVNMTSNPYLVEFTNEEIQGSGTLQFRIVDYNHTGHYFNVDKCSTLDETLYIKQVDNFNYILSYISSGGGGTVDAYTKAEVDNLLEGKSNAVHTHDDRYFTEAEVNNALVKYIPLTGSTAITGTLRTKGELQSTTANGLRLVQGNYGFFIRHDGSNVYFMFTNSGDQYGNWNSLRPFLINNSTGRVTMSNGLSVSDIAVTNSISAKGLSTSQGITIGGALTVNGASTLKGTLNLNGQKIVGAGTDNLHINEPKNSVLVESLGGLYVCSQSGLSGGYKNVHAAAFTQMSSKKAKENIVDITEQEARKILDVNIVSFDYKENFGGQKNNFGVIAEDVIDIIPSAVNVPNGYDEDDVDDDNMQHMLGVDYSKFVPHLIKMVQMQQKEIDKLKSRLEVIERG